jgi:hypothetical protein
MEIRRLDHYPVHHRNYRIFVKQKTPFRKKQDFHKERRRHTLPHNCSTICAGGLNYSVRDGKR